MSFVSTYFEYDHISSETMGVELVKIDRGLISSPFGYERTPMTEKINGRKREYFFGIDCSPLRFSITIAPIDGFWTKDLRMRVAQWLFQPTYKPFISGDNLDVIYYCMATGSASRFDTSLGQGYATIDFVCNSPFAYSPTYIDVYDYSVAPSNIITLNNLSNVEKYFYPEVEITMVDDTDVTITNLTNKGEQFIFTGLELGEIIYVNNESKQIISSLPNTYRLGNFNKKWLRLVQGANRLQIDGNVKVVFKATYPIIL